MLKEINYPTPKGGDFLAYYLMIDNKINGTLEEIRKENFYQSLDKELDDIIKLQKDKL
jgi:hypothetical protein